MHICTVIKEKVQCLQTERNRYVFKRDQNDDSDWEHLTSFGIEFQTEEEAIKDERSPSVTLLCVQVYREEAWCISWSECCGNVMAFGFSCSISVTYDDAVLQWQW